MGKPVLYIDVYAQDSAGIEYREAAKMGILAAIKILGQTDEEIVVRIEPTSEPDEPDTLQHHPIPVLLNSAKMAAFRHGHPDHLDLGTLIYGLRNRWSATEG